MNIPVKLDIGIDVVRQAAKCHINNACLSDPDYKLCKIDYVMTDEVFFLKCLNDQACAFRTTFGDVTVCTCKVRKEIFRKYEV